MRRRRPNAPGFASLDPPPRRAVLALVLPRSRAISGAEAVRVEAIAGYSQFGLAHDDWGNRFPSWNTIPIRHVVLEQQSLDRNPYLAETSSIASILDPADGGRIFGISPAQARFNRESVAYLQRQLRTDHRIAATCSLPRITGTPSSASP